jgi:hypothetical protein
LARTATKPGIRTVVTQLDALLKPLGFARSGRTWSRNAGCVIDLIDVIDVQVTKVGGAVTVNAGVLDEEVYKAVWNRAPDRIEQPSCTVGVRIGALRDGKDKWWELNDADTPGEVAANVRAYVLPFLERMQSRDAMMQWLIDTRVTRKGYPLPILNLAILHSLAGNRNRACGVLAERQKKPLGAWRERVAEIAADLGCPSR